MATVTAGNPNVIFISSGSPVTLDSALTVSDANSTTFANATVEITGGGFAGDDDVLSANTGGTAISASYNSGTETLTLTGTDTLADYQAVLDTVTFESSSSNPTGSGADPIRTISWAVSDGTQSSSPVTTSLNILSLNSPPSLPPAPAPIDFNGDGVSDVLLRNSNDTLAEWLMEGATISSSANPTYQALPVAPDSSWSVAGIADFNGDGTSDVLWRQSTSDLLTVWLMNGSSILSGNAITYQGAAVKPDSSWSVTGVGDFSGDGDADILWRQSKTGTLADWSMNGSTITSSASLTYQGNAVIPDSTWSVAGIGDFNADGKSDILWRQSTTGLLADWQMNGATITSGNAITYQGAAMKPDASWSVAAIGDFTNSVGAGPSDMLWRQSTTGSLAMWLMNGSTIESVAGVTYQGRPVTPDSTWSIVEVGDFDGRPASGAQNLQLAANASDILWQQSTTGTLVEWQMNGAQIVSSQAITSQGSPVSPPNGWQSQAKPTDFT